VSYPIGAGPAGVHVPSNSSKRITVAWTERRKSQ